MDLIDIYRTFHPKTTEYTFFSIAHGTFSRIDHILGHKSSLRKFKKIEIVSSIFSDHNAMRVDINYRKKSVKNTNTWRLNNTLLNNEVITEEIKGEIKKYLETNDNGDTTPLGAHTHTHTHAHAHTLTHALKSMKAFLELSFCLTSEGSQYKIGRAHV